MLYKNVGDYLLQHVRMIVIALFNRNIFFLFFNLISTDCRPYRWGFVTTLWRLSCGAGFRRKLLKLHTISGGNYACIYVIVNCLNNTPLAVRLFNVCLFGEGGFGFRNWKTQPHDRIRWMVSVHSWIWRWRRAWVWMIRFMESSQ